MTKDADEKKLIRERMQRTGESYSTARRMMTRDRVQPYAPEAPPAASLHFTPRLQRALTGAAAVAGDGTWVGCEHLLIAMLGDDAAIPTQVLQDMGVREELLDRLSRLVSSTPYNTPGEGVQDAVARLSLHLELPSGAGNGAPT